MPRLSPRRAIWRAALLTGIFSGTFSTAIITLGAPRIGRSRALDWMEIGTVILGSDSVVPDPGWVNIAAGIVVHQSADLFWALVFFGLGARWTVQRSPTALLIIGIPWAVGTAVVEYYLILPWLQPLVPMQVPYWTALAVHLTSAAAYPVFPWIHGRVVQAKRKHFVTARRAAVALCVVVSLFVVVEILTQAGWELRLPLFGGSEEFDRRFMPHMTAHHEIGVRLAGLSAANAARTDLREFGRLMIANQQAELEILRDWWRRWFGGTIPPVPMTEHHQIPGMPSKAVMNQLAKLTGAEFKNRFLPVMIEHHQGAVMMADMAWQEAGDPRLRIFAESLRHAQRGPNSTNGRFSDAHEYGLNHAGSGEVRTNASASSESCLARGRYTRHRFLRARDSIAVAAIRNIARALSYRLCGWLGSAVRRTLHRGKPAARSLSSVRYCDGADLVGA